MNQTCLVDSEGYTVKSI